MSLKVVLFKSLGVVSYSPSVVTMAVTDGRTDGRTDRITISISRVSSSMLTRDKNESVQTWYRESSRDTLEVILFWVIRSKVKVTGSITLHSNTLFRTTTAFHSRRIFHIR